MRLLFLLLAAMLVAPAAWGADGDSCIPHAGVFTKLTKGIWREISCVQVCDGKDAANDSGAIGDCTEVNMSSIGGVPDLLVFEYEETGGNCSGTPAITVTTGPVSGGTPSYALDSTAVVIGETTSRIIVDMKTAVVDNFLFFSFAADTGADCDADAVDVRMHMISRDRF